MRILFNIVKGIQKTYNILITCLRCYIILWCIKHITIRYRFYIITVEGRSVHGDSTEYSVLHSWCIIRPLQKCRCNQTVIALPAGRSNVASLHSNLCINSVICTCYYINIYYYTGRDSSAFWRFAIDTHRVIIILLYYYRSNIDSSVPVTTAACSRGRTAPRPSLPSKLNAADRGQ